MSNKRKTFTAEFKTKVVLEVLKDNQTVAELSVKHGVTPKNINNWFIRIQISIRNSFIINT